MLTKATITVSAAVFLGLTSGALAAHSTHHRVAPGYGYDVRGGAAIQTVKPFTAEEKELFDRASRSSPL